MIKAIFFDIDGTLVTSQSKARPSTRRAIAAAQKEGVLCGIATGRGPYQLNNQIDDLSLDVYVTYNGQFVYTDEEVIYAQPFDHETLMAIVDYADEHHRQILFGSADKLSGSSLMMMGQTTWIKRIYPYVPRWVPVNALKRLMQRFSPHNKDSRYKELSILKEPIYQCVLLSPESETEKLRSLFPGCHFTRSNPYSVDIIPAGGSKIKGIQACVDYFGIKMEEVMAFGDSWNDSEMLTGVGVGVAMGNALPDVKKLADYVTDSNEGDGIYQALRHFEVIGGAE